tara:strand:+ start:3264 stop:3815 length:552 start_codon:yes stop_codon:yes gene_type:complete
MTNIKKNYSDCLNKLNKFKKDFKVLNLEISKDIKIAANSKNIDILVLYSEYNSSINKSLLNGYLNSLQDNKYKGTTAVLKIPGGAFELPLLSSKLINKYKPKICLIIGCILKGDTQHYEFLSSTVINAIRNVSFDTDTIILNGILTVENNKQAIDRAGKKYNKGSEYANASIKILNFIKKFNV